MADGLTEVVQATRDEHDAVGKARFGIPEAIFDDLHPLDPRQNMLSRHPKLSHQISMGTFGIRSLLTTPLLDRLIVLPYRSLILGGSSDNCFLDMRALLRALLLTFFALPQKARCHAERSEASRSGFFAALSMTRRLTACLLR